MIDRPVLVERALAARRVLVSAPSGFGKTTLLRLLAARTTAVTAGAFPGEATAVVVDRLSRALGRLQLPEAGDEGSVDELVASLERVRSPLLLTVDDAHEIVDVDVLVDFLQRVPGRHLAVVASRVASEPLERWAVGENGLVLDVRDLRLDESEVAALLVARLGNPLDDVQVRAVADRAGGWAAAVDLAARGIASGDPVPAVLVRLGPREPAIGSLLDAALSRLHELHGALIAVAHLPRCTDDVAAALCDARLRTAMETAGLPVVDAGDGTWSLPDVVRDHVRTLGPLDRSLAAAGAAALAAGDFPLDAALLLSASGADDEAARLLEKLHPAVVDRLALAELDAAIDRLPQSTLDVHPRLLLHQARLCAPQALLERRASLLERAREMTGEPGALREIEAEIAFDLARDGHDDEAEALAGAVLAAAGGSELYARARATFTLGLVAAWRGGDEQLSEALRLHDRALELSREIPSPALESALLLSRGFRVRFDLCDFDGAQDDVAAAAALTPGRRHRGVVLTFHGDIAGFAGRIEEAERSLAAAESVGEALADDRILGYVAWERMKNAARQGDLAGVLLQATEAERHGGDWFEHPTGMLVLADAAESCDLLGDRASARRFLERALERMAALPEPEPTVQLVEAAMEARHGDPARARLLLAPLASDPGLPRRLRWRPPLLDALAARRAGDPEASSLAAAAFDLAAAMGVLSIVPLHEPQAVRELAASAVAAGSAAARMLVRPSVDVRVLGRFEVTVDGRELRLPAGQPTVLVKMLALSDRPLHVDQVADRLWPDAAPDEGRKLLRNVVHRLQRALRDVVPGGLALVVRDDHVLRLAPGVETDRQRLAAAAATERIDVEGCRAALAGYGAPLPGDLYEDWLAETKDEIRTDVLSLASALAALGDAADVALLERLVREHPDDDELRDLAERLRARFRL